MKVKENDYLEEPQNTVESILDYIMDSKLNNSKNQAENFKKECRDLYLCLLQLFDNIKKFG
jgi:hypothetical protein